MSLNLGPDLYVVLSALAEWKKTNLYSKINGSLCALQKVICMRAGSGSVRKHFGFVSEIVYEQAPHWSECCVEQP